MSESDSPQLTIYDKLLQERNRLAQRNTPRENVIICEMWLWHNEMVKQARIFAEAKTEHGRQVAKVVIAERAAGERSAAVAEQKAELDDEIYKAHIAYRLAEQMITACREALRILHAELDKIRTERADSRAADSFTARNST